ncbi:DNA-3-methyladenine glycosylase II [Catalinimonas alkaloidigena]|uniref:DNA-3-methyladenine glycosylase II n=1 Tax=Catalinimonas alkaloidigena TaxID=1075417 RepID=A0A1G9SKU7_9BACT|nr:DNA glycosylase [Catalinimonas alkaloidigena]SDM35415.1 DNA-3-methyladenine glycosylase II [Catalinimonas alkaloidigena]
MNDVYLPLPPHFSFDECRWFLNRNYDDCLHCLTPKGLSKAVLLDEELVVFSVEEAAEQLEIRLLHGSATPRRREQLATYVRDWLDLERDLAPFYQLLSQHPTLAYMPEAFGGLRLIGIADLFETLCWCIIGQQINLTFAYTLKRRLVEAFGTSVTLAGERHYVFPTPGTLAEVPPDTLRAMQFSRQKTDYVLNLAALFRDGALSRDQLLTLPTTEARRQALLAVKGIGVWTANYALMKNLKALDCIPYGDIGLLNALRDHGLMQDRNDRAGLDALFRQFAGWESYLVFYLWRSLAVPASLPPKP